MDPEPWLTTGQAALILGVHPEMLELRGATVVGLRTRTTSRGRRQWRREDIEALAPGVAEGSWQIQGWPQPGPNDAQVWIPGHSRDRRRTDFYGRWYRRLYGVRLAVRRQRERAKTTWASLTPLSRRLVRAAVTLTAFWACYWALALILWTFANVWIDQTELGQSLEGMTSSHDSAVRVHFTYLAHLLLEPVHWLAMAVTVVVLVQTGWGVWRLRIQR
jgi:hypothetical protein